MAQRTHLNVDTFTENVGILEVDGRIFDGVAGVDERLSFSVEFDGVGRFIDSISCE